jgi:DNA modification methylase
LKNHIIDFIFTIPANIALDPFAGNGDLLSVAQEL